MKKITITLDAATAARVQEFAKNRGTTASRFVSDVLLQEMGVSRSYKRAMSRFLRKRPVKLSASSKEYSKREKLHDRKALR